MASINVVQEAGNSLNAASRQSSRSEVNSNEDSSDQIDDSDETKKGGLIHRWCASLRSPLGLARLSMVLLLAVVVAVSTLFTTLYFTNVASDSVLTITASFRSSLNSAVREKRETQQELVRDRQTERLKDRG